MTPSLDLDQFLEEQNADPFVVTLGGKDYAVPPDIPWPALQKYSGLSESDIAAETITDILSLVFGSEQYAEMRHAGLKSGGMAEIKLFTGVMTHIGETMMGEDAMGKLISEATKASPKNRTNGKTPAKPRKSKAKRSR